MKLVLKISKLAIILVIAVSLILFSASLLLQDKVADIVLKSLSNSISTKFEYKSLKLSFLRRFPKASLELKDVFVHSSDSFHTSSFYSKTTDTLLAADNLSVEFSLTDILKRNYTIESIYARNGRLNLYTDKEGLVNWNISGKSSGKGDKDLTIDLEKINVRNIKARYENKEAKLLISGIIRNGRLKSRIVGDDIDFTALSKISIDLFMLGKTTVSGPVESDIDLVMRSNKNGIFFNRGTLSTKDYDFDLKGSVLKGNFLDLAITGDKIDLARIGNYLPVKYRDILDKYDPAGLMNATFNIKGPLSSGRNPLVEISFILKKGTISSRDSHLAAGDISLKGTLTNGAAHNASTSTLSLRDMAWTLGSGSYTGSFTVTDFKKPVTTMSLKGRIYPAELREFFSIKQISTAAGTADVDLSLETAWVPDKTISIKDVAKLKPEGTADFNSLNIGFNNDSILFNDVNGSLDLSGKIRADNLRMRYKGQQIKVNGDFINLPEWLAGLPVTMKASADIHMDRFIPGVFFPSASSPVKNKSNTREVRLPDNIILNINFSIDSISYRKITCSSLSGTLEYKPKLFTFKSVSMNTLNGNVSGSGFIVQNINRSVITRGNFIIKDIDIKKAFTSFNNFGQSFIKAENMEGTLSGSLSLMLPFDPMMNPKIKELTADGKYTLVKGALIDFDPVKQLSSFIELSELENIHFEELQNDFFIRNNILYIPQMDVRSSAADLSVNGKHGFDNNFEYHVKVRLSEILSKKRKKSRNPVTEFGAVEDDGLGRTSLLLKIVNKGTDDIKVSYDLKAAGTTVKNNIRKERQNLKTILNEEYGWYKSDTSIKAKPVEKKSRVKIKWDDSDTTYNVTDTVVKKKKK